MLELGLERTHRVVMGAGVRFGEDTPGSNGSWS